MNPETIFVQTDPAFNVVLDCLNELTQQDRLEVIHMQTASLENIESDNDNDAHIFGGKVPAIAKKAFARTASAVVRMCMLEAVGVARNSWPGIGRNAQRRNEDNLNQECLIPPLFRLANDRATATRYWSRYDQLYPHFRVEHEISRVNIDTLANMPSMMLIFRGFTEVIEITTTFTATPRGDQQFDSYVHVICIVRKIKEGEDGKFTERLKELMQPVEIQNEYIAKMTKVKKVEDLESLLDALGKLEIKGEEDKD